MPRRHPSSLVALVAVSGGCLAFLACAAGSVDDSTITPLGDSGKGDGKTDGSGGPDLGVDVRDDTTTAPTDGGGSDATDAGCVAPRTVCSGVCTDTATDPGNCGACGKACTSGEDCVASACVCKTGSTKCGADCVDLAIDPKNCGACGTTCPSGTCTASKCACPTGTTDCSGSCVDTSTDPINCGACGKTCATGEACTGSVCVCAVGLTKCGTTCVDLTTDPANCGTCGKACTGGAKCVAGACASTSTVLEDFDKTGWLYAPWSTVAGGTAGTPSTTCKHDGTYGMGDVGWIYRTDVSIGASGQKLAAWGKPGTGRIYLGFGATSAGCWSLVMAPNTNEFKWQQNSSWGYTELPGVTYTYTAGKWYKMEVTFGAAGAVTGRLYDSDGTTVLATTTRTLTGFTAGGVALRSFGSMCTDTITR